MPKYRKTALVDAEQFLPPHSIPVGCFQRGTVADVSAGHGEWMLKTLEGDHALRGGDYICTGPAGEKWNVEQSIFEATYEEAEIPTVLAQVGTHPQGGDSLEAPAPLSDAVA